MIPHLDILGLGCVAIDDLLYVDAYPGVDAKAQIRCRHRQCGGLTATALVAASRLGSQCAYAGVLGDDDLCRFVLDRFRQERIDVAHVRHHAGARPVHSTVIVEERRQTRTILYDLEGVVGADSDWPEEEVIRAARVLFVDNFGEAGMIRAARVAREASIPVVADFENDEGRRFAELLALVDHLILSQDFARKLTGRPDPAVAARELWTPSRQAVVVTCGEQGCWHVSAGEPCRPARQTAFAVPVVDTTGCGDVFHGAYAAALTHELDVAARVRFASAAAALKATARGGQGGIPTRAAVEAFLNEQDR
ncbi:MAG: PfkB family carbohydrate kinase [Pirellulales bacterium]